MGKDRARNRSLLFFPYLLFAALLLQWPWAWFKLHIPSLSSIASKLKVLQLNQPQSLFVA